MKNLRDYLQVEISADGLQAQVLPLRRYPRRGARVREILSFLASREVTHGVERERVQRFVQQWRRNEVQGHWVVARGQPASEATPARLKRLAPPRRDGRNAVELLPRYVEQGEPIFRLVDPVAGKRGRDVRGMVVEPASAVSFVIPEPGVGITVEGRLWIASRVGFLVEQNAVIEVSTTLIHLHDLPPDVYTWPGDAVIGGSLLSGVSLRLGGDLELQGGIGEDVIVEAGGSVHVQGVVRGGGSCRLLAGPLIELQEVFDTTLVSEGDICIHRYCQDSVCMARGKFLAGDAGCQVSGGRIDAVRGAEFFKFGSGMQSPIQVSVGWSRWVNEELKVLEGELRRWHDYHGKVYDDFRLEFGQYLERRARIHRLARRDRERFERAEKDVLQEQERIDRKISQLRTQQSKLLKLLARDETATIQVRSHAGPGARLSIRGKSYVVSGAPATDTVFGLFPETGRIHAVPAALFESSQMSRQA